jgi:hypothetical protein
MAATCSHPRSRICQRVDELRLLLAFLGFVPIGCLCLALFGWVPLVLSVRLLVLPLSGLAIAVGARHPDLGRQALLGLCAGIAATAVYDMLRLSVVFCGGWHDFIPVIGQMALGDPGAVPIWGYLWRFVYDGGAMGMTFALLPRHDTAAGLAFGAAICACLYATLLLAPGAQEALFRLAPLTATSALLGHLIYGGVLGWLVQRWERLRAGQAADGATPEPTP